MLARDPRCLPGAARHLHRDPAARLEQQAGRREQHDGLRDVLEHVSQRDGAERDAGGDERASVHVMHRRTGPVRGVGRGSRVELDALDLPPCPLCEVHESPGVGSNVEKTPRQSHAPRNSRRGNSIRSGNHRAQNSSCFPVEARHQEVSRHGNAANAISPVRAKQMIRVRARIRRSR